ncbi:hypothetical protein ACIPY3_01695 [Paenarthrobacter sp. NPDC089714]|uniref:hypothetical protein n=1 Tax=Paenarthrobacter sp. NPDC089714 TaxID=3364377 RepID=UPI00381D136E
MDAMEDTVQHSGTTWPEWDRADTADYVAEPCSVHARADGRLYQRQIEGSPVDEPQSSVDAMEVHWKSMGYKITNIFDNRGSNTTGIEIHAVTPRGMLVIFMPTKTVSFIKVVGECTLDPVAAKKTT